MAHAKPQKTPATTAEAQQQRDALMVQAAQRAHEIEASKGGCAPQQQDATTLKGKAKSGY